MFHAGWAYVYDDGRVVWATGADRITQQRLSPEGLGLVREGEIDPASFVLGRASIPDYALAEPVPIEYQPSNYAICAVVVNSSGHAKDGPPADQIEALLPEAVRTQVAGTAGSFRHGDWEGTDDWRTGASSGSDHVQTCFILGSDRARAVWAHTTADPRIPGPDGVIQVSYFSFGTLTLTDGTTRHLWSLPNLPHGVGGAWGG